jgi:hypothetical protein
VDIAHSGLESQNFLPDDRKTEMARFDDAGMDRAHGNLMDALAANPDEGVVLRREGLMEGWSPLRERGDKPEAMIGPGTKIGQSLGKKSKEIGDGSLKAAGGGKN